MQSSEDPVQPKMIKHKKNRNLFKKKKKRKRRRGREVVMPEEEAWRRHMEVENAM